VSRAAACNCRTCPWVKVRRNEPSVDGAYTPPNSDRIPPFRVASRSSLEPCAVGAACTAGRQQCAPATRPMSPHSVPAADVHGTATGAMPPARAVITVDGVGARHGGKLETLLWLPLDIGRCRSLCTSQPRAARFVTLQRADLVLRGSGTERHRRCGNVSVASGAHCCTRTVRCPHFGLPRACSQPVDRSSTGHRWRLARPARPSGRPAPVAGSYR